MLKFAIQEFLDVLSLYIGLMMFIFENVVPVPLSSFLFAKFATFIVPVASVD